MSVPVSLKFFYFLMQYLRRILLCDVNRYHIVPGTFVRLPRNLGRLFRQPVLAASLAPGEESLGATTEALKGFCFQIVLGASMVM